MFGSCVFSHSPKLFFVCIGYLIKGHTDKPLITDVPCITIPSKGIVNKLYLQTNPFDANNTIALIPKDRQEINLEYVIFTYTQYITGFISSTHTNNYLNKETLKNIEIEYQEYPIQVKLLDRIGKFVELKEFVERSLEILAKQAAKNVGATGDNVTIDDVFVLKVGCDDEMTEKYAYDNKGKIPIYSGASSNAGIFRYTDRIDYNYEEYITWSISGKAGTMYLRKGPCCLTRDCGIMIPKNKSEINLEWFILSQQSSLRNFAIGRGGLGRLKKNLIELYSFARPKKEVQDKIVEEYKRLGKLKKTVEAFLERIDAQLRKPQSTKLAGDEINRT